MVREEEDGMGKGVRCAADCRGARARAAADAQRTGDGGGFWSGGGKGW